MPEPAPPPTRRLGGAGTSIFVALGTGMSRATGYLRILALAYLMRTTNAGGKQLSDAYFLANNLPNIVYDLVLGGILSATLVPLFTRHFEARDDRAISALVTTATTALAAVTVVATAAAPLIVRLLTAVRLDPSVDADRYRAVATTFAYFFLPQIFFYGVTAIASALLNAKRRFLAAAWAPVVNNLVVIAMLLLARAVIEGTPSLELLQRSAALRGFLGFGTTAGVVAMAVVLLPAIAGTGLHIRPHFDWRHPAVRALIRLSGWTAAYVVSNQVALLIVTLLAQRESGGLVAYNTMYIMFQLPYGLLAVTIMTIVGPELASDYVHADMTSFRRRFREGTWSIVIVMTPMAVILGFLAAPVARLVGSFGEIASAPEVLSGFAAGLVAFSVYLFAMRGFYARHNTKTPFSINLIENALNVVFALILVPHFGVAGLAWSFSLAYLVAAVLALAILSNFTRGLDFAQLTERFLRLLAVGVVTSLAAWFARDNVSESGLGRLFTLGLSSLAVMALYVLLLIGAGVIDRSALSALRHRRFR